MEQIKINVSTVILSKKTFEGRKKKKERKKKMPAKKFKTKF